MDIIALSKILPSNGTDLYIRKMNWSSFLYVYFENGYEGTVQLLLSIEADIDVCLKDGSVLYILFFFIEDFTKIKLTCFIDTYIHE